METPGRTERTWWDTGVFLVLLAAAAVGSAAIFPYASQLTRIDFAELGISYEAAWIASAVQSTVLAAIAIFIGMRLGHGIGLGPRNLRALLTSGEGARRELNAGLRWGIPLGAVAALVIVMLDLTVFAEALLGVEAAPSPAVWAALLASLYGGIVEEILLRLGVMTFLVWLLVKVSGSAESGGWPIVVGNIGAALLFGAGHLPATATIVPLTALVVLRALMLNGIPGVAFGWLYARYGLLAAIASHFTADIVLHVILPMLSIGG